MKNKLSLNDDIKTFLDVDNKQIWNLIVEDNIADLLALPAEDGEDIISTVVKELFSCEESETLNGYDFVTIREHNGTFIRNLVRLIYALDINGNYEQISEKVINKLLDSLPEIVEHIQKETFGYPARMIEDKILSEAAIIRAALMNLIYYFNAKEDLDSLHFVTVMRTTITLAIMGNYKNVVGHDMVETAKIKERVGELEAALTV